MTGLGVCAAFPPEEVGGEAEEEKEKSGGEVSELCGVEEGENDSVADDGGCSQDEDERRPGVAGNAIGDHLAMRSAAERKDRRSAETIKNPPDKNHPADKLGKFPRAGQDGRPDPERHDRSGGGMKARMNFGEFFEKEIVIGHRVEDPRRGENYTVRRTKGRDENGERDEFPGPRTEDSGDGGGSDGVAGSGDGWAEGKKISQDGDEIESNEDQRSEKKRARERFLRLDHLAGAVGAELPAFVGPQNSDHAEAEVGKKREAALGSSESGRQVGGMAAECEQH